MNFYNHWHLPDLKRLGKVGASLDEWNAIRADYWQAVSLKAHSPDLFPNGLTCAQCGGDLYDTGQVKPGIPSQMKVKCVGNGSKMCNFSGYRSE